MRRPAGEPRRRQRCARRQSLPLHRLPPDRRSRARGLHRRRRRTLSSPDVPRPRRRSRRSTTARMSSSEEGDGFFAAPASEAALAELYEAHPDATLVAGCTDVGLWVTKDLAPSRQDDLARPRAGPRQHRRRGRTRFRSAPPSATCDARRALAALDPDLGELMRRFGGVQVRTAGTVGGNIANGSPIGDLAPALIALGATLELRQGERIRSLAAGGFLHRLRQAGPRARRVRRAASSCRSPSPALRFAATRSPSASTRTSRP